MSEERMSPAAEDESVDGAADTSQDAAAQPVESEVISGDVEVAAEASEEPDVAAQLATVEAELLRVKKALAETDVRAQAEVQNMRRRMQNDVEKARKFALEKFGRDILGVADSLERGLGTLDPQDSALKSAREGMELTLKQLLDIFARFQIEQIDPAGAPFDPEQHEAMTQIPYPDAESNTVVEVLEKGYALNGRLLRPARVVVAK